MGGDDSQKILPPERNATRSILPVCDTVRPTARTGLRSAGHFCKAEVGHLAAPKSRPARVRRRQ
jgi:hypothetical protein